MGKNICKKLLVYSLSLLYLIHLFSPQTVSAYHTNMSASIVVGQPDFGSMTGNYGGTSARSMTPTDVWVDNGKLFITDYGNSRVMIFNSIPTSNFASADVVVGQPNFTSGAVNQGGSATANTLNYPWTGLMTVNNKLLVGDFENNRVLIFDPIPTQNNASASVVIGQPDMTTTTDDTTASKFFWPSGIAYDEASGKLLIGDYNNRRVLVYNKIPTTNGVSADVVIGQADFTTVATPPSQTTLGKVYAVRVCGGKVLVADYSGSRILIWNSIPTTNGAPADVVIGQKDFTTIAPNQGGVVGPNTFHYAQGLYCYNDRLFVLDATNNRVLIFNKIPTVNNASADIVIGQPNFTSKLANQGANPKANTINIPDSGIYVTNNQLFVSDSNNSRILIYNNILSGPQLSFTTPIEISDSKLKVMGNIKLGERSKYALSWVKANINGNGFSDVTFHDGGRDENTNSTIYEFFHEFEPWANNGTKENWKERGYTFNIKASSLNAEEDQAFFFQPFQLNSTTGTTLPTLNFTVNKYQWNALKDNLNSYEIHTQKEGESSWTTFQDNIPVDSSSYDSQKGVITVKATKSLSGGKYKVRVVAKDKWGHRQESNSLSYSSTSLESFLPTNLKITNDWFPIQINSITGVKSGIISSFADTFPTKLSSSTSKPIFSGIAPANSTVSLLVTNAKDTNKSQLYSAKVLANSTWTIKSTLFNSSIIDLWVTDASGKANLIPAFTINVGSGNDIPIKEVQGAKTEVHLSTSEPTLEPTPEPKSSESSTSKKHCFLFVCW